MNNVRHFSPIKIVENTLMYEHKVPPTEHSNPKDIIQKLIIAHSNIYIL